MSVEVSGFPLSVEQRRLVRSGAAAVATATARLAFDGPLAAEALRAALDAAVERHEILRTTLVLPAGLKEPLQVVGSAARVGFAIEDLRGAEAAAVARAAARFVAGEPPCGLEALLVRTGDAAGTLHLRAPSAIADGVGLAALLVEVAREAAGEPPAGEPLQYADVAAWQDEVLGADETLEDRSAWLRLDAEPILGTRAAEVYGTRRGGAAAAFAPRSVELRMPLAPLAAGSALGRALAAPSPVAESVLLAAFAALLARASGRDRIAVAVSSDGRIEEALATLPGPLARHLPIVWDADLDAPLARAAEVLGRSLEAARGRQECFSWEGTAGGALPPDGFLACAFELAPAPHAVAAGGSRGTATAGRAILDRFEIALRARIAPGDPDLELDLAYDAALLTADAARRLLGELATLLEAAADAPERPLGDLDLLAAEDRAALAALEGERVSFAAPATIPAGVAAMAAVGADRIAVSAGEHHLSAGALDRLADSLARRLAADGVGAEDRVGVAAERSLEQVVALLGVLRAGAAYLPLEPGAPPDRLGFVLDDAKPRCLLVGAGAPAGLAARAEARDLAAEIGAARATLGTPGAAEIPTDVDPDALAYVLYTSGSTGRPKGVAMSHRGIANRLRWMQREAPVGADDRVLAKTPFVFDASIWELFVPLWFGARLVLAPPGAHRDAAALADALVAEGATVLQVVPSLLAVLAAEPALGRAAALERLYCGGEALAADLVARFAGRFAARAADRRVAVHNLYGPTECAIDAAHLAPTEVAAFVAAGAGEGVVPIGRPIANVTLRLLDPRGGLALPGSVGELWIGGCGLARGYFGRPDLTADRFRPDPFAATPGARLYRAGDLARLRPDGALDFLGRADEQVKIRGYRVEPGEVEAALREIAGVAEAAVVAPDDPGRGRTLAAFYVASQHVEPAAVAVALARRLPEAMVPSRVERLAELPRLAGGKLDRRALLERAASRLATREEGEAPAGPTEELLAGLWCALLGLDGVGATESFFDLGGHSLLATQAASRVREAFGVEMPLVQLFETPSVRALGAWIDGARRAGAAGDADSGVTPTARDGGDLPISFAQARLWFLAALDPRSPAYNLALAFRVRGALDGRAFAASLDLVAARHETLRTTFPEVAGVPVQRIAPPGRARIAHLDLSLLADDAAEVASERALARVVAQPFDLAVGPLWRCLLIRRSPARHTAILVLHHIVSDGWSTQILLRELAAGYAAFAGGEAPTQPPLPIQYADFAAWQRRTLVGARLEGELSYWRRQLAGEVAVLDLPADRPRRAAPTHAGARLPLSWSGEFSRRLAALARGADTTLFMALLAGFGGLLARVTGQEDVVVGSPVANRTRLELEGLIGFFVNTLALRLDARLDRPFSALLRNAREVCLGAALHQDLPFERLIEEIAPARDLSRSPLFQVMLALENAPRERREAGGLELEPISAAARGAKFDLTLDLVERRGELFGALEYAVDLFDPATVVRLEGHLRRFLEAAAAAPETPLADLELLAAGERQQLLLEWNDTALATTGPQTLDGLVLAQAAATPDAIAVEFEDRQLSYGELARRALAVARGLAARGVVPGDRVGIEAERSLELPVALLGTLAAGAAFLPLAPELPAERRQAMLRQAAPTLVLATARGQSAEAVPVWSLADTFPGRSDKQALAVPFGPLGEGVLAYVIFTSGSTGLPKGAANTHEGIVNRLSWMQRTDPLEAADRVLQKTPCSFDVSIWELFWPLTAGARLVLARPGEHRDPMALAATLSGRGVTIAHFVPSMLEVFLDQPDLDAGKALRRVVASGEALSAPLARRCLDALGVELANLYGPTEAAIEVTAKRVAADDLERPMTIGRPITNVSTLVVDRFFRPVPIGVAGELLLGGVALALGYVGDPAQTAERFVPAPAGTGGAAGARAYRTGDRVRMRADGEIEFLGRLDHQVKVRGVRIELGEVEGALRAHPAVREAVVVARGDGGGSVALVAYLTALGDATPEPKELRAFLASRLPEAMVPSLFVPLDALPKNASGKVDRRALPAPGALAPAPVEVPPRDAVEEAIAAIWCEVLGRDSVSVDADFFLLGGHSLLAAQVVARLRQTFRLELPLRRFFGASTVADLATVLVESEPRPGQVARIAELLRRIDRMSDEERQALASGGAAAQGARS